MFYTGTAYFWKEKGINYSDITGFCMKVKKHLDRGCMHIIRKKTPPPLQQFYQCICWAFMMVMCCSKSLSTGFHTDHSLDWAFPPSPLFSFFKDFLSVAQVLYALVSLTRLSRQTETLCSFCRGCQTVIREALLLQRYRRLFVSDRRLTAASPGVDSWHGGRMPVLVQAPAFW